MPKDWKTTLLGILTAGAQIGKSFAPPKYQPAIDSAIGILLGLLGWQAKDTFNNDTQGNTH